MYPAFVAKEGQDITETEIATQQEGQVVKTVAKRKRLTKDVEVADIGCGFGGLLVALSPAMPDTLCLGRLYPLLPSLGAQFKLTSQFLRA